jgi:hypothetical protein
MNRKISVCLEAFPIIYFRDHIYRNVPQTQGKALQAFLQQTHTQLNDLTVKPNHYVGFISNNAEIEGFALFVVRKNSAGQHYIWFCGLHRIEPQLQKPQIFHPLLTQFLTHCKKNNWGFSASLHSDFEKKVYAPYFQSYSKDSQNWVQSDQLKIRPEQLSEA